jgi:hypothetical protein
MLGLQYIVCGLHIRYSSSSAYHLGELDCLVSTFPVNLYFINPLALAGDEEGAAKSEDGISIVPPTDVLAGAGAGAVGAGIGVIGGRLTGWILRIRGIVADNGMEARDFMGGRGVDV